MTQTERGHLRELAETASARNHAAFDAATNPEAIIGLLDQIDRMEARTAAMDRLEADECEECANFPDTGACQVCARWHVGVYEDKWVARGGA